MNKPIMQQVVELRKQLGLKQKEVAKKLKYANAQAYAEKEGRGSCNTSVAEDFAELVGYEWILQKKKRGKNLIRVPGEQVPDPPKKNEQDWDKKDFDEPDY